MAITAPKGTRDILPSESATWQWVESVFREVCRTYSYREIRIPTFEQTELFQRGVGDTTDIVQKEMYTFEDKGGRSLTLRPEGTAGVVRSYLENGLGSEPSPLKLFYNITTFRYEKMQKGRYREFHQLGCECFGSSSARADAELISLVYLFFQKLGLHSIRLKLNSIGCPQCRPAYRQTLQDYLRPHLDHLCEDCQKRFEKNPLRILDCKVKECQGVAQGAPAQLDHLCEDCRHHWEELKASLDAMEIPYEVDTGIVRGLDYYTRTVFEFVSENVGTQGTICGGGRYDGLVSQMGGQDTPAVGFALGVERLLMEIEGKKVPVPDSPKPDLFLASFPDFRSQTEALCLKLRREGLRVETDICDRSLKAQLKYANRLESAYLIVLGETEWQEECGKIKRLADGEEQAIPLADLASFLRGTRS